jgi:hypothetical protein
LRSTVRYRLALLLGAHELARWLTAAVLRVRTRCDIPPLHLAILVDARAVVSLDLGGRSLSMISHTRRLGSVGTRR